MKKYTITCTEDQLRLIAHAVEDWHRFLAGQCDLSHATSYIVPAKKVHECRKILDEKVRHYVVPDLPYNGQSYKWDGGDCPNDHQRHAIAQSYGIYRQILHFFAVSKGRDNVYSSDTLTCDENMVRSERLQIHNREYRRRRNDSDKSGTDF